MLVNECKGAGMSGTGMRTLSFVLLVGLVAYVAWSGDPDAETVRRQVFAHGSRPAETPAAIADPGRRVWRCTVLFLSAFLFLFPALATARARCCWALPPGAAGPVAWTTREGLRAEAAYAARKVARRSGLSAKDRRGGADRGGFGHGQRDRRLWPGLRHAHRACRAGLHLLSFGLDPMADKGWRGRHLQTNRVAKAVEEGEKHWLP